MFSSSLMYGNFVTMEQRRLMAMRIVEEGNRCGEVCPCGLSRFVEESNSCPFGDTRGESVMALLQPMITTSAHSSRYMLTGTPPLS